MGKLLWRQRRRRLCCIGGKPGSSCFTQCTLLREKGCIHGNISWHSIRINDRRYQAAGCCFSATSVLLWTALTKVRVRVLTSHPTPTPTHRGREHEYEKTSAAMASRISIKLKHAGVTHELELDPSCECPYNRAAALLSLPKDRIKILRLGKLLPPPGSPSLRDALVAGGMYMVTGTSADAQLPSSTRRHFASAVEALSAVYASLTWVFVRSWLIWLLSMLSAAPRVGFRFVSSMVVPPARPDGGQRPPRAHAE